VSGISIWCSPSCWPRRKIDVLWLANCKRKRAPRGTCSAWSQRPRRATRCVPHLAARGKGTAGWPRPASSMCWRVSISKTKPVRSNFQPKFMFSNYAPDLINIMCLIRSYCAH
jgi:hypothetical protein